MKVLVAVVVGLVTFSFAGVAAAGSRCGSSEPTHHNSLGALQYSAFVSTFAFLKN